MRFARQEYWSGLPFPSPWDLPDPGIDPSLLRWQADSFTAEPPGKPTFFCRADPYPPGCIRWVDTQKGSLDGETKEISTLAMLPMSQALDMVNHGG